MLLPSLLRVVIASICLGSGMTQKVTQAQPAISTLENEAVTLDCVYEVSGSSYYLFWYKQPPSGEMIFLIHQESYRQQNATEGRYSLNFQKSDRSISLTITALQLVDSAVYFCALPTNYGQGLSFGRGTGLSVLPYVKEPDPAVYQLGGSKSNQISVCLFTDFDSETNVQEPQGPAVISLNSTVLDMKVMNSKSNAALAWGNSTDFKCNGTFNEKFFSSSDFSCDATLIAKNFETDMNLNFHNLIVIGLRILLLKVAGFNLFMTLRLWSR